MPSIDEENDNFEFHQEICKAEAEDQIVVCSSDRSESDDGMEDVRLQPGTLQARRSPPPDEDDQPVTGEAGQCYQTVNKREDQQHRISGSLEIRPVTRYNLGWSKYVSLALGLCRMFHLLQILWYVLP